MVAKKRGTLWRGWCKCVPLTAQPVFFHHQSPLSSAQKAFFNVILFTKFSGCYLSVLLVFVFLSFAANMSDIFLFPLSLRLSLSDEGRDLLSCLIVWACFRVCSPLPTTPLLPACLSACLAVPPYHTSAQTTKTLFAASERVPACPGIPTSGENSLPHCYALIACQVPFLFWSLVFLPLFSLIFSLCLFHGSLLCWQHLLCLFTLLSCPGSLNSLFLSFFFFNLVDFHELCRQFFAVLSLTWPQHTHRTRSH